ATPSRRAGLSARRRRWCRRTTRARGRSRCRRSLAGRRRWGSRRAELVDGVAERLRNLVDLLGGQAQAALVERLLVAAWDAVEQRLAPDLLVQQEHAVQQPFRAWRAPGDVDVHGHDGVDDALHSLSRLVAKPRRETSSRGNVAGRRKTLSRDVSPRRRLVTPCRDAVSPIPAPRASRRTRTRPPG